MVIRVNKGMIELMCLKEIKGKNLISGETYYLMPAYESLNIKRRLVYAVYKASDYNKNDYGYVTNISVYHRKNKFGDKAKWRDSIINEILK